MVKRHIIMDKVLLISFALVVLFAWADSENVIGLRQILTLKASAASNVWDVWFAQMLPAIFNIWMGALLAIALVWYLISKDKSEALALFLTPGILIWFGVQDIISFIIGPDTFVGNIVCWADALTPVMLISDVLGETCPTTTSFGISVIIGVGLAYFVYKKLKVAEW